jgi:hypothetical protein
MGSPFVPIVGFGLVVWGFVLLLQGTLRRDPTGDLTGYFEARKMFAHDYDGIRDEQEKHPRRLLLAGFGLIALGLALALAWGAIWA